jgi:LysM repeat protein
MRRSPARFLAPIALVAFAVALYSTVNGDPGSRAADPVSNESPSVTPSATATAQKSTKRKRRTYTVKPGDTLAAIAEKTNVSLDTLRSLNPGVDTLSPGQKLRLSK